MIWDVFKAIIQNDGAAKGKRGGEGARMQSRDDDARGEKVAKIKTDIRFHENHQGKRLSRRGKVWTWETKKVRRLEEQGKRGGRDGQRVVSVCAHRLQKM
jgi:hypothetical protein